MSQLELYLGDIKRLTRLCPQLGQQLPGACTGVGLGSSGLTLCKCKVRTWAASAQPCPAGFKQASKGDMDPGIRFVPASLQTLSVSQKLMWAGL